MKGHKSGATAVMQKINSGRRSPALPRRHSTWMRRVVGRVRRYSGKRQGYESRTAHPHRAGGAAGHERVLKRASGVVPLRSMTRRPQAHADARRARGQCSPCCAAPSARSPGIAQHGLARRALSQSVRAGSARRRDQAPAAQPETKTGGVRGGRVAVGGAETKGQRAWVRRSLARRAASAARLAPAGRPRSGGQASQSSAARAACPHFIFPSAPTSGWLHVLALCTPSRLSPALLAPRAAVPRAPERSPGRAVGPRRLSRTSAESRPVRMGAEAGSDA